MWKQQKKRKRVEVCRAGAAGITKKMVRCVGDLRLCAGRMVSIVVVVVVVVGTVSVPSARAGGLLGIQLVTQDREGAAWYRPTVNGFFDEGFIEDKTGRAALQRLLAALDAHRWIWAARQGQWMRAALGFNELRQLRATEPRELRLPQCPDAGLEICEFEEDHRLLAFVVHYIIWDADAFDPAASTYCAQTERLWPRAACPRVIYNHLGYSQEIHEYLLHDPRPHAARFREVPSGLLAYAREVERRAIFLERLIGFERNDVLFRSMQSRDDWWDTRTYYDPLQAFLAATHPRIECYYWDGAPLPEVARNVLTRERFERAYCRHSPPPLER